MTQIIICSGGLGVFYCGHHPENKSPSPLDFNTFLPWACKQFIINVDIESLTIAPTKQQRKSDRSQKHLKSFSKSIAKATETSSSNILFREELIYVRESIKVTTTFDYLQNLIGIKLINNPNIPREFFKILALTVEFHPTFTSLTANKGIDVYSIYEIAQFLPKSMITEICLDGVIMENPNLYMLLEAASHLRCLSLAKCQIGDECVISIADKLSFSEPAAKTLTYLNLTSNTITDKGASHLAEALKSNRNLTYLNLADNQITDTGASIIFDTMLEFPIKCEELAKSKIRFKEHMEERRELISKLVEELMHTDSKKYSKKKVSLKGKRPDSTEGEGLKKNASDLKTLCHNLKNKYIEKAEAQALKQLGEFIDPFYLSYPKNGISYCTGNNTLMCLNLAYNNLTYCSLKKLLEVLRYQESNGQKPRGLFRMRLEGNFLPVSCDEYTEINRLLSSALDSQYSPKKSIVIK